MLANNSLFTSHYFLISRLPNIFVYLLLLVSKVNIANNVTTSTHHVENNYRSLPTVFSSEKESKVAVEILMRILNFILPSSLEMSLIYMKLMRPFYQTTTARHIQIMPRKNDKISSTMSSSFSDRTYGSFYPHPLMMHHEATTHPLMTRRRDSFTARGPEMRHDSC